MSSITLKANQKIDGSYVTSNYWKVGEEKTANAAGNNLYVGVTKNSINRRTRITFFPNSSIFADQTIKAVTLTLKVKTLFSSEANTKDTNIKISATAVILNRIFRSGSRFLTSLVSLMIAKSLWRKLKLKILQVLMIMQKSAMTALWPIRTIDTVAALKNGMMR